MKRLAAIITTLIALISVPAVAANTAARAAAKAPAVSTACPAMATHPNITIWQSSLYRSYSLTQSCNAVYASWYVLGPTSTMEDILIYNPPSAMYITWYKWMPLGRYTLQPDAAWNASYNDVPQATEYFYVKLGSHAYAYGYRSGNWIYMRAYVNRYNPNANYGLGGWVASGGRYVTFYDYYYGAWHAAGHAWTGSNGWTPYVKRWAPTRRNFHAVSSQTATIWGWTSGNVYR